MRCQPRYREPVYIWLKNNQSCLFCDEVADGAIPICMACETELPWLGDHCQTCALPLPAAGLTCSQCLDQPPTFERVIAPWTYSFPIDSLITRFKHSAKWPFGACSPNFSFRPCNTASKMICRGPIWWCLCRWPPDDCANAGSIRPRCWRAGSARAWVFLATNGCC
jgi:hypothetical protein